jgi:hypothetical protein
MQLFLEADWPTQPGRKANVADYADGGSSHGPYDHFPCEPLYYVWITPNEKERPARQLLYGWWLGGWSLLHEVIASKASGMARFFMKSGGPAAVDDELIDPALLDLMGLRPLRWAPGEVECYSLPILQAAIVPADIAMLLDAGHVVDWSDERGRTALHVAAGDGVPVGLGRIVALPYRSSAPYQNH